MANVSLDEKIGQMLMVGFRGLVPEPEILSAIAHYHIGGVILFSKDMATDGVERNIQNPEQVLQLITELQSHARIPMLIAVDQEGGQIARLNAQNGFSDLPAPADVARFDKNVRMNIMSEIARMVSEVGFNVNFSPCVDLNINPDNPIIGKLNRAYSQDPAVVIECAREQIAALHQHQVVSCLKHFPGHGSSEQDSHLGFVDITKTWQEIELQPYQQLIAEGFNDPIMVGHLFHSGIDPKYPASLSFAYCTTMLRESFGFSGVIVADDMQMQAISDHYSLEQAILLAIAAGIDLLIFGNNTKIYQPNLVPAVCAIIKSLVASGMISVKRIDESYERICALKKQLASGPIQQPAE